MNSDRRAGRQRKEIKVRKTHRYMIGFDQDRSTIYGKDEGGKAMYADPMTLKEARRKLKDLEGTDKTVYKLVPVKAAHVERKSK